MDTSKKGRDYIVAHEGLVLTGYLDPVGVPTIGIGFTNRSSVARSMLGKIKPGMKITRAQAMRVFKEMLDVEYEPPVEKAMPGAKQHEFDVGVDCCWNLGPRSLQWKWAQLWRDGLKSEAADYLAANYHKAGGRVLAGLVRRRKESAEILRTGTYPVDHVPEGVQRKAKRSAPSTPDPVVKEAQKLLDARGFNPGAVDGWMGRKTKIAILKYQEAHPHLVNDGILGPATLAQLRRDTDMTAVVAKDIATKGGGGSIFAGLGAFFTGLPWSWIIAVVVVGVALWAIWRYRDVLVRRFNTLTGKKVID